MAFEELGYASAAIDSYRTFARLKRDGAIPPGCRFLVSLPTPLAPVSAFVALEYQAELEPVYEAQMRKEVERILAAIPADQLAIQWDARYEFAMLEGAIAVWFDDVRAGVVERLLRLARMVPAAVELGYHLCYGDDEHGHFAEPEDAGKLVDVANALAATLDRPLNWIHMPVPHEREDDRYFAPLGELRLPAETELYLGLIHAGDDEARDGASPPRAGTSTASGSPPSAAGAAAARPPSAGCSSCTASSARRCPTARTPPGGVAFEWPDGFVRVPDEDWTNRDIDEAGLAYDHVDAHGWYRNLDLTVEDLARTLRDGDLLLDYSGGTGILLDRLRLRIFDRRIGVVIVDASAKFLRVALEKYQDDPPVALRLLRYLRDERGCRRSTRCSTSRSTRSPARTRSTSTPTSATRSRTWMRALRPGGGVFVNFGNIRNPRAKPAEWILDETVWVINDLAEGLVRSDPRYVHYREAVDDAERMRAHAEHRDRVFVAPRPLDSYVRRDRGGRLRGARRARGDDRGARERVVRVPQRLPRRGARLGRRAGADAGRAARPRAPDPPRDGDAVRRPPVVQRLLDLHHRAQAVLTDRAVNVAACLPPQGR